MGNELATKGQELILVKQLPIIEDRLKERYLEVQARLEEVSNLAVTEENYKEIKRVRAELNKEFAELEAMRKKVKTAIEAPYKEFENGAYKMLADAYKDAVTRIDGSIKETENILKEDKKRELLEYYEEYRQSLGLDKALADPKKSPIKVGLTGTMKSLKEQARQYLDRIDGDLKMIQTLEDADEVLAEYRVCMSVTDAVRMVNDRHKRIADEKVRRMAEEEARRAREANERAVEEAVHEDEVPVTPTVSVDPEAQEEVLNTVFRVYGTLTMLKELKAFLVNGGYRFENVKGE